MRDVCALLGGVVGFSDKVTLEQTLEDAKGELVRR